MHAESKTFLALASAVLVIGGLLIVSLAVTPSSLALTTDKTTSTSTTAPTTTASSTTSSPSSNITSGTYYPAYGVAATIPVAPDPGTPLFDPQNGDIYVPGSGPSVFSYRLSVISGSSNELAANISVGYTQYMAFDSANGDLYLTGVPLGAESPNGFPSELTVVSGATNTVVANFTFADDSSISPPSVDSSNGDIYFSTLAPGHENGTLWTLSGVSNALVANVGLAFTGYPFFDPMNGDIYLPDVVSLTTLVWSTGASAVVGTLPFYSGVPALETNNDVLFFPDLESVVVVSGDTNTLVANISAGVPVETPAYDPVNEIMYVPCNLGVSVPGILLLVSVRTDSIVGNLTLGSPLTSILRAGLTPVVELSTGNVVVASDQVSGSNTISIISGSDNAPMETWSYPAAEGFGTPVYDQATGAVYLPMSTGQVGAVLVISAGSGMVSSSPDGLSLSLSVNATTIQTGEGLAIAVDERNHLDYVLNTTSESAAPGGIPLSIGSCGLSDAPMGWAVAPGYETSNNVTTARWLTLYDPASALSCPDLQNGAADYSWQPLSDIATLEGSGDAFCSTDHSGTCGPTPLYLSGDFAGYWSGSNFTSFQPGVYTVVGGDDWGALMLIHVSVASPSPPIGVVSALGPIPSYNPGGPNVSITLVNLGDTAISSLNATLSVPTATSEPYLYQFNVSSLNPLLPGQTTSEERVLLGAGFSESQDYPLMISGVTFDGQAFSYTTQIQIIPPT